MSHPRLVPVVCAILLPGCFVMSGPSAGTAIRVASVQMDCPAEQLKAIRSAQYTGGSMYVLEGCGARVTYECMGTVCQKACSYEAKPSSYTGAGETGGSFSALVGQRAAAEFDCPAESIRQVRHADTMGGGTYVLSVCEKEVTYNCMGSVCNLACN